MGYNFRDYNPNQLLLLAPNLDDWLPQEHIARFISDVVDALDLKPFFLKKGTPCQRKRPQAFAETCGPASYPKRFTRG